MKRIKIDENGEEMKQIMGEIFGIRKNGLESQYYTHRCEYCGMVLAYYYPKQKHVNACQSPSIHFFCSKECKYNWIFQQQKLMKNEVKIT